ncbi:MAG: molybdopterin-dependent oxidoreductase [Coriobacteriaceae bacterium]|jgi:anaerobic dimethyl sulfoxide reductase subunit A|nr:molybdopterin-dependent oxidoreductase [Coriobacteriaceae bacterium]
MSKEYGDLLSRSLQLSRRDLVKWGAAAAVISGGSLAACAPSNQVAGTPDQKAPEDPLTGGEWVTVPCTMCAQFRCVNRAYMVDGVPIRQKTDDSHPYSLEYPNWRACIRGRAARWSFLSPARLKYPMKRKSWQPGGGANVNGHLRGKDEWERITWDEALDITAAEFKRIAETYGTGADDYGNGLPILNLVYSLEPRFLNVAGYGTLPIWGQNSTGGWPVVTNKMLGNGADNNDRMLIMEHAELVVLWGCNQVWSDYGDTQVTMRGLKERGVKIISVDPWFNPGNNGFVTEWVPCRPGTDIVLMLAVANELIRQGLVDQDFLDKHTVGFDEESLHRHGLRDKEGKPIMRRTLRKDAAGKPEYGPDGKVVWDEESVIEMVEGQERHRFAKDNFKDYVLGTYDGVEKSAEWASPICGTPVEMIRSLAKDMGTIKPMTLIARQANGRHYHGASMVQAFYAMGWMTGNVGRPGAMVANTGFPNGSYSGSQNTSFYAGGGPYLGLYSGEESRVDSFAPAGFTRQPGNPKADLPYGAIGYPWDIQDNYEEHRYYGTCFAEAWDAVLTGKHHDFVHGMKDVNIKGMIKLHSSNTSSQTVNANKAIQAHRAVEFVFAMDIYMNTTTRYADIVVPCTTYWEEDGHYNMQNREVFIGNPNRVIDPLFEARDSLWVDAELCKRFGGDPSAAYPNGQSIKHNVFTGFANAWVVTPDGKGKEPLISFTEEDLAEIGVTADASRLKEGRISYQEFKKRGFYQVELDDRTIKYSGAIVDYIADEDHADPSKLLTTQTGRLEIYSMNLANYYQVFGLEGKVGPRAEYVVGPSGYEEASLGEYPYQFINVQPHHRSHSTRTDNQNVLEYFDDVLFINPLDAEAQDIRHGDTVLLTSNAGKILRRAAVKSTVMPGVIVGTHGATNRLLDNERSSGATDWDKVIDYGGNANTLCASYLVGQGHQAFNTVIVKMEKWSGEPLLPNYRWELDTPGLD